MPKSDRGTAVFPNRTEEHHGRKRIENSKGNHGYGIARWLRETSSDEFQVEEGALYPALRKLEKRGLINSAWEITNTGREAKIYRLTVEGEEALDAASANWDRYVNAMASVMGPGSNQ
jgi:DNA-binding PadR family transcriptional regulator